MLFSAHKFEIIAASKIFHFLGRPTFHPSRLKSCYYINMRVDILTPVKRATSCLAFVLMFVSLPLIHWIICRSVSCRVLRTAEQEHSLRSHELFLSDFGTAVTAQLMVLLAENGRWSIGTKFRKNISGLKSRFLIHRFFVRIFKLAVLLPRLACHDTTIHVTTRKCHKHSGPRKTKDF